MSSPFLSICIPSYNRPNELWNLLASIDCNPDDVEVVICEDLAPMRAHVRAVVNEFSLLSAYSIHYYENPINYGFDGNLRRLIEYANGVFVLFMGDDDLFVAQTLDLYIAFLKQHRDKPYVLRSYLTHHPGGRTEVFRYLPNTQILPAGETTVAWLFKRSVTICGFTISRSEALKHATDNLDGTLLYQVYLMSMVCMKLDSIYCDIPIANAVQTFRKDTPMFGNSSAEVGRYTPGSVSEDNSINFAKAYFEVTTYLDKQYHTNLTYLVRQSLSKYAYPFLSIQRKRGIRAFLRYSRRLEVEVGLNSTPYYYIYKWALALFGERFCDRVIGELKNLIGHAPDL